MTKNEMPKIEAITPPEQGRSMIEMLGTLAIMGVLSIGGIAGYGYAVTKYKANETMEELNNRAIVYVTQLRDGDLFSGTALRNGEFGDKTALGYGVSATVSEYENEFNVTLSDIPFEVCEQILKNYTIPTEISVNGNIYNDVDENIDICGEGNTDMVFAFNGDLSNDWESVEVSGEPNNGETTVIMTGTETITPGDICQNIPYTYQNCWKNVVKAEAYCASKGGYVSLSDIDCELKNNESSSSLCSRLKTLTGYYIIGKMVKVWSLPDNAVGCLCDYNITSENGSIALQGYVENNNIPLCWDDYRDILAEYTGTENEESTIGTPTGSETVSGTETPTVTAIETGSYTEKVCYSNENCNTNEFCNFDTSIYNTCEAPEVGYCHLIKKVDMSSYFNLPANSYVASEAMSINWWGAQNFCKAIGKNLIDVSEKCSGWENIQISASGNAMVPCPELYNSTISGGYWTANLYDSCEAFRIKFYDGIYAYPKYEVLDNNYRALCE